MRLILLGFVAGCWALQRQGTVPATGLLGMVALLLAAVIALAVARLPHRPASWPARLVAVLLGLAVGFCWSAWRAQLRMDDWLATRLEARDIEVRGVVSGLPAELAPGARFAFTVEAGPRGERVPGRIVLNWREAPPELRPGQRYAFTVRLRRPRGLANPHGFDYAYWLLAQGYGATGYVRGVRDGPKDAAGERLAWRIEAQRAALRDRIRAALPPDSRFAAVLVALVVGDQRGIDSEDWLLFNRTGVGHLVSISGLHITMIAGMAAGLAHWAWRHSFGLGRCLRRPLPLRCPARQAALVAAVLAGLGYGLIAGLQIPALRTVAMLSMAALAAWGARTPPASMVLAWAALAALLLDPWAVMLPGFWLSFGAVGVIFLAAARPEAPVRGFWPRLRASLAAAARTQWAVTVGLVPLTLLLFRQFPVISPLANAVAIPVVSMLVTPLALLGAVLPAILAGPLLALAHQALAWLVVLLQWLASPGWAVWETAQAGALETALALLGTLVLLVPAMFGLRIRLHGLLLTLPMLLARGDEVAPGEFRAVMLDVGQGTAVLVQTRAHALLYDAGPAYASGGSAGAQVVVPHLRAAGVRRLDHLMVSHEDIDHAGGAQHVLEAVPVDIRSTAAPPGHALLGKAQWVPCGAGQHWEWDGVLFTVLHPAVEQSGDAGIGSNARSCVLRIDNGRHSLLLTGDIGRTEERELADRLPAELLRAEVLVVPHHGSGTSSSPAWLAAVGPDAAVFQLGYRNRYQHPRAEVWERYGSAGILRYRTDETGAVTMATHGEGYSLEAFRQSERRYWREAPEAPR
ncbi:DNA internalization-related competence protein ComEC/Rec2 [Cupriavidus sp. WKF15]|uniref:DNA internalization-related competence protein ComEC/Rec2 n=1 Tax=Cupriavidus sp. WKF15 TaxID=3032282 RepID=UPI0023E32750|nr:DNA internalization-related competence protein ComEC/Rec2 [Cupriavidus sp. WKF15]WER44779.1 DNA internalization-related competence protein ComEC/Rec2 [Cupriavidus sp. WKF15]